jgi:hypothetical protein
MLNQGGGEKNTRTWDRWTCGNGKSDPEAQRKSSLSDCTWLENEFGPFNLESLKFLMHFREQRSSLILTFFSFLFLIHIYFFLYFFFFLSFSFSFFLFLSHQKLFICSSLNSKIALCLPPLPCLDVCASFGKEVIEIRWVPKIFFLWRDTWNLQYWHHLAIFLELMIHSHL